MIKAIETRYAGYLFRSRLEARWAVFFDALKYDWQYEPEGFELVSGKRYLPDFRINLPDGPLWFEIKPEGTGSELFYEFMHHAPSDWRGTILHEIPDPRQSYYGHEVWFAGQGADDNYQFCICRKCNKAGFEFGIEINRMDRNGPCKHEAYWDEDRVQAAFAKARSARFEHDDRETYATL
jgi:hypothetical protein